MSLYPEQSTDQPLKSTITMGELVVLIYVPYARPPIHVLSTPNPRVGEADANTDGEIAFVTRTW
jgi:hypothetical protein